MWIHVHDLVKQREHITRINWQMNYAVLFLIDLQDPQGDVIFERSRAQHGDSVILKKSKGMKHKELCK
jgi:hypothetical protein